MGHQQHNTKSGSKGALVKELQGKLIAKGYTLGSADGDFGQATFNAVISFQTEMAYLQME